MSKFIEVSRKDDSVIAPLVDFVIPGAKRTILLVRKTYKKSNDDYFVFIKIFFYCSLDKCKTSQQHQ